MRVALDARFVTHLPRRGIGNYSLNLINELVNSNPTVDFVLYISKPDSEGILPILPNVKVRQLFPSIYPLWENLSLPIAAIQDKIDVLHCLGNTGPLFLPKSIRLILSIMDVIFLQEGEFIPKLTSRYQKLGRVYKALLVPIVARKAKKIITISEFSKQDILQLIPKLNSGSLSVTYLSCDPIFKNISDVSLKTKASLKSMAHTPFIFCLGAEDPRKNTLCLVRAYLRLLAKRSIAETLVICGYANWEKSEAFREVKDAGAEDRVKFLDFVSIEQLAILYSQASVFVYPSVYEGFGMPLLEAFSLGCPVIASNATSIPEVGGDAAIYFNPFNEHEISEVLFRVLSNSSLREAMKIKGIDRAKQFSWSETARKTIKAYQE
jgi:glycosyltransferase involved in cell wall biosynthesis